MKIKEIILKYKNKKIPVILLCVGVFLMLVGGFSAPKNPVPDDKEEAETINTKKLEQILESVEGAGKVKVFITYDETKEKIPATDFRENVSENSKSTEETVKTQSGDLYIVKTVYPKIRGILVTATGAADEEVANRLLKSVKAATGVALSKIHIEKAER